MKGNIDLRDLRLKNSVLDKLDLPFSVVEGALPYQWGRATLLTAAVYRTHRAFHALNKLGK